MMTAHEKAGPCLRQAGLTAIRTFSPWPLAAALRGWVQDDD